MGNKIEPYVLDFIRENHPRDGTSNSADAIVASKSTSFELMV
jgi:hypothetical protein